MAYRVNCKCLSCIDHFEANMREFDDDACVLYDDVIAPHIAAGTSEDAESAIILALAEAMGVAAGLVEDPTPHTQEEADIRDFSTDLEAEARRLRMERRMPGRSVTYLRVVK